MIQDLVGRSRGRPLGFFSVVAGLVLVISCIAEVVTTRGLLDLGAHKTPGLSRGFPTLAAPAPGGSRSRTPGSRGSYFYLVLLRADWGDFPAMG